MEPSRSSLGETIVASARRRADAIAIVEEGAELRYGALAARATAVASTLTRVAAGDAARVVLLFRRRSPAIEAIVGTLLAGHAYVPLDIGDPDARLEHIVRDCDPAACVVEAPLVARARELVARRCPVLTLDEAAAGPVSALAPVDPSSLAYVLYTSGSTGEPKGVLQTHEGAAFFAAAYARSLAIVPEDRLSLLWSLSFAAANMHVFAGLAIGATLCARDLRERGVIGLADWLEDSSVSVVHTIPTVFRELCASLAPGRKLAHVRAIDLAGEAAHASDVERFHRATRADAMLVNQLGATEADVIAQFVVRHDDPPPAGAVLPVGRSPAGLRTWIRRDDGSAAAPDETGAIVVEGRHLSPGYWRRPEQTRTAYPPTLASGDVRAYVSGDRGRIDASGNLSFLGREGSRVKIRGHSVDLTEVEAAFLACPEVRRVIVFDEIPPGGGEAARLVAVVELRGPARGAAELRRAVSARLPSYMLPAEISTVETMPLTSSGKIDRAALRARPASPPATTHPGPPNEPVDQSVADVLAAFRAVLRQPRAGPDDDFFALGGDSLAAVELARTLAAAAGGDLPAGALVEAPTPRALARYLAGADRAEVRAVRLREGDGAPLWCVPGIAGEPMWFAPMVDALPPNAPVWGISFTGLRGRRSIDEVATLAASVIRRTGDDGPLGIIGFSMGGLIAIEIARRLAKDGVSTGFVGLIDTAPPGEDRGYLDYRLRWFELPAAQRRVRLRMALTSWLRRVARRASPRMAPRVARIVPRFVEALFGAAGRHMLAPFEIPTVVFRAVDPPYHPAPDIGWSRYARGPLTVVDVPGHHYSLASKRNVPVLAEHLAGACAEAMTRRPPIAGDVDRSATAIAG